MVTLILSGAGGSSNWLPFVVIIGAILVLVKCVDVLIKVIDARVHREVMEQLSGMEDTVAGDGDAA
jgi:hypothetical protein